MEHLILARKIMEILCLENQHGKYIDKLYGIILSYYLLWKINEQVLRKNATENITICHGKMILISTHYNVYNIIYMYTENHTEKCYLPTNI